MLRQMKNSRNGLRNEKTMPFGEHGEHASVNLIDYNDLSRNEFVVTTQFRFIAGQSRRADLVFLINGIPLVIGEAKTPVRPAISWFDGAVQLEEYQNSFLSCLFLMRSCLLLKEKATELEQLNFHYKNGSLGKQQMNLRILTKLKKQPN